ncbi:hypothetical protein BDV06DRAFT_218339 [Aspergillus oleicola]
MRSCLRSQRDFSYEDAAGFLQNWLFFGVLWEVFGPLGKGANHNYVKARQGYEHGIITVASLDECMLELTSFITPLFQSGDRAAALTVGHRIEACLRTVFRSCRMATCEGDPRKGLCCRSEVAVVEETFISASAFYVSQLQSPPSAREENHLECTRNLCMARQLNEAAYRTAHVPPPHTNAECDYEHYGPMIDDVVSILEAGGVPLLSITPLKKEPFVKVEVEKYTEGKRYIAFSHV